MTTLTVTATQGGSTHNGMALRVLVLTGASDASLQPGGTAAAHFASTGTFTLSVTTTQTGSRVYGVSTVSHNDSATAAAATTLIDNISDASQPRQYVTFKATSLTGTPGATTLGFTVAATDFGVLAEAEILTAGTLAEDASAPAVVSTTSATTLTTASFTPPDGSLLLALVPAAGGATVETMTVSGGGLTWTQVAVRNGSGEDYAGVWVAQVPPTPSRPLLPQPQQPASWLPWMGQRDRRDANAVATAANPLTAPLDTAWQADGLYSHLYADAHLEQARRIYFYQRSYISDPSFYPPFTTPATPLDTSWQADAQYHHLYNDSHLRDRRAYFYQRSYISDPSLLAGPADPLQLNPEQSNSSDLWRVAIVPAFYDRRLVPQQRAYYDVSLLTTALLENELLGGAQTPRTYNTAATHKDRWWMPEQPPRLADPLLIQTAQLENELLGGAQTAAHYGTSIYIDRRQVPQQRPYVSDPLLLTTAELENELLGGAQTFAHYSTSAYIDRREVPQQRLYVSDPSFYPPVNPADPLQVAWLPVWLEYNAAATNAARWWMPQQPLRISDPSFYLPATDPLTVAWGAGGSYWHLYNRGADATDRRLMPQQRAYVSDPSLLATALLENELLGGAATWLHYGTSAYIDRRQVPQQRSYVSDPLLLTTALLENELLGGGQTWLHYGTSAYIDRRAIPQQRPYISDPSFYVTVSDPLTVAWGAGGNYWHLYNRAADGTDRRQVPQQRAFYDVSLLATALLENELLGGAQTPRTYGTAATHCDRRLVPQQRAYFDTSLLATALLENELLGGAGTPGRYLVPATHADRRLVPQQRRYISDPLFYPLPPATVPATGPYTVTGAPVSAVVTGLPGGSTVTDPRDARHTVS